MRSSSFPFALCPHWLACACRAGWGALPVCLIAITLSPSLRAGEFLYFAEDVNSGTDDVGVLDVSQGALDLPFSQVSNGLAQVAFATQTGQLWVSRSAGQLTALDIRTGDEALSIDLPSASDTGSFALSPDESMVYAVSSGEITAYRTSDGALLASATTPRVASLALSADGSVVYWIIQCCNDTSVKRLDAMTLQALDEIPLTNDPRALTVSEDGSTVMFLDLGESITLLDVATAQIRVLPTSGGQVSGTIALSPDGAIAYVGTVQNGVEVLDTGTGDTLGFLPTAELVEGLALNADGSRLYFGSRGAIGVANTQTLDIELRVRTNGSPGAMVVGDVPRNPSGLIRGMRATTARCENVATQAREVVIAPRQQWRCAPDALAIGPGETLRVELIGRVSPYRHAYVPSSYDRQLYVVSLADQQVVDRIPLDSGSEAVEVSADGTEVYVASAQAQAVLVFDALTHARLATIPTGGTPVRMALSPDGEQLWVSNSIANTVVVIDLATRTLIGEMTAMNNPLTIRFSPDGSLAYVAQAAFNSVTVLDTATRTVADVLNLGFTVRSLDVSPDGSRLYLVSDRGTTVVIYDLLLQAPVGSIDLFLGGRDVRTSLDATRLYATDASDSLTIATTDTLSVLSRSPVSASPTGIVEDPATGLVYVSHFGDGVFRGYAPQSGAPVTPSVGVGNLTQAYGNLIGPAIPSSIAGRVDNGVGLRSYLCLNRTTGQQVSTVVPAGTRTWDCSNQGLMAAEGDDLLVRLSVTTD